MVASTSKTITVNSDDTVTPSTLSLANGNNNSVAVTWQKASSSVSNFKISNLGSGFNPQNSGSTAVSSFTSTETNGDGANIDYTIEYGSGVTATPRISNGTI